MKIRQAKYFDESGIGKVHVDTWLSTYKGIIPEEYLSQLSYEKSIRKWKINIGKSLKNSKEILLVAEEDNKIIGFCEGGLNRNEKTALSFKSDLMAIYILKNYQRKGVGKKLVLEFINKMQNIGFNSMIIWTLENNSSVKFYEKLGGVKVDEKIYTFAGKKLKGIAYGWQNLDELARSIKN